MRTISLAFVSLLVSSSMCYIHHHKREQSSHLQPSNFGQQRNDGVNLFEGVVDNGFSEGRVDLGDNVRVRGLNDRMIRRQNTAQSFNTKSSNNIVFPTSGGIQFSSAEQGTAAVKSTRKVKIPVSLFLNKSINSFEDWTTNFHVKDSQPNPGAFFTPRRPDKEETDSTDLVLRTHSASGTKPVIFTPIPKCEPQNVTVQLDKPSDPAIVLFPTCARLERCSGCCRHESLACEPTAVEKVDVTVRRMKFIPETEEFMYDGPETFVLEKHVECDCKCRVKEEHCNGLQEYHENECQCVCINENEASDCTGRNKFWDSDTCSCSCRNEYDCSTGFFFDPDTCSCQAEKSSSVIFPRSDFRFPRENSFREGLLNNRRTNSLETSQGRRTQRRV